MKYTFMFAVSVPWILLATSCGPYRFSSNAHSFQGEQALGKPSIVGDSVKTSSNGALHLSNGPLEVTPHDQRIRPFNPMTLKKCMDSDCKQVKSVLFGRPLRVFPSIFHGNSCRPVSSKFEQDSFETDLKGIREKAEELVDKASRFLTACSYRLMCHFGNYIREDPEDEDKGLLELMEKLLEIFPWRGFEIFRTAAFQGMDCARFMCPLQ